MNRYKTALAACAAIGIGTTVGAFAATEIVEEKTLFDFTSGASASDWVTINDSVMGGVSAGYRAVLPEGVLAFSGSVSLENNGGFASVQSRSDSFDLNEYDGLLVRLRGDGNRYSLTVRTDYPIMAGSYYGDFETRNGEWQEILFPFDSFQPRSFGRVLGNAPALNSAKVRSVGFMISDKQTGPFTLEVDSIKAVRVEETDPVAAIRAPESRSASAMKLITLAIDRGVPLFNDGQHEACAAVYEVAAQSLVDLSGDALPTSAAAALRRGIEAAHEEDHAGQRAWTLRHALDTAMASLLRQQVAIANEHQASE